MGAYLNKNFYTGLKVILFNEPYVVESSEFVRPGKGQPFFRVVLRHLLIGSRIEKTFKSTDSIKAADILEINMMYLYNDGKFWFFMKNATFEQLSIDKKAIGSAIKWLTDETEYLITLWNNYPISVTPPNFVNLKIVDTDPGFKGDTVNKNVKLATLSTGVVVKVPLFLKIGEKIKVNTHSGEYVSRVR